MNFRRRGLCLAAAAALTLVAATPAVAAEESTRTVACSQAGGKHLGSELKVGDVIRDGVAGATVQPPGETVISNVLLVDGSDSLTVSTEMDGEVVVEACGADVERPAVPFNARPRRSSGPLATTSVLGECQDNWWEIEPYRWYWPYAWYLKTDTVPPELSVANVTNALIEGTQSMTATRNKCGMIDIVPAEQRYDGPTNGWANISGTTCLANDWHNVADFAGGGPGVLAQTCTWPYPDGSNAAGSSDMRINDANNDWMPDGSGNCGGYRYVIRAVTAHERGHTYGLRHVGEAGHPHLTMSTVIGPCSDQEFWLGKGDVNGMRARYPF